jgi:hypothetical protein
LFARDDVEAVIISAPDHSHALPALLAMRRGWHVYCEKPLAHNIQELRLLARAAQDSGLATQMGNQHHSSAGYQRAAQLLEHGVLGKIRQVLAWTSRPHWPQGIARFTTEETIPEHLDWPLWLGCAPPRAYHSGYHPFEWRGWCDFGTGTLGDMGTHLLDPVVTGLHLTAPSRIWAQSSGPVEETFPAWSVVHFEFSRPDGTSLEMVWHDGGKQPPPEVTGAARLPDDGVLVLGERGKMFIPKLGQAPHVVPDELLQSAPPPDFDGETSHVERWLRACRGDGRTNCDFTCGALLTEICLLGNVALRAGGGQSIDWDAVTMTVSGRPELTADLGRSYPPGWEVE